MVQYIGLTCLISYVILVIIAGIFMYYPFKGLFTKPPKSDDLKDYRFEEIEFKSLAKNSLKAWFVLSPNNSTGKTLILVPGWGHTRVTIMPHIKLFVDSGFHVFTYDQRSHGGSAYAAMSYGPNEAKDFMGAIAYLKTRSEVNMEKIGVLGESMASGAIIYAISEFPELKEVLRAIVIEGPFASTAHMTHFVLKNRVPSFLFFLVPVLQSSVAIGSRLFGLGRSNHSWPIKYVHEVSPVPFMIIRGANDHMIPEYSAMQLINAAKEPKEVWLHPNGHHRHAYQTYPDEYKQKVLGFYNKYL